LWFTEPSGNKIGRITTTGTITEFSVPTASSNPWGITAGPDGAMWFTELSGNKVGRITTTGTITEYTANNTPNDIATGSDGNLWFTEQGGKIGKLTTSGVLTEYVVPTPSSNPYGIAVGPDGNLWFTEAGSTPQVGRITTAGVITEFPVSSGTPWEIAAGPDGNLWFTYGGASMLGRITTSGVLTDFPVSGASGLYGITAGPDNNMWFTENAGNKVGFMDIGFVPAPPPGPPPPAPAATTGAAPPPASTTPQTSSVPPPPPAAPPQPKAGKSGNLQPISGFVCVAIPLKSGCLSLNGLESIPVGSVVDTTHGTAGLTVSAGHGRTYAGTFSGGKFRFAQVYEPDPRGHGLLRLVTRLTLVGGNFSPCPGGGQFAAAARRRVARYLEAKAAGAFRVVGASSSAVERGTQWKTEDTCDGTLTQVREGSVLVSDFGKDRKVVVTAGHSYFAASERPRP
jgi:hypothetical protein